MHTAPIVGIIPAAGIASRLQPLPFSKELFPIGFRYSNSKIASPKPVASYLVEQMKTGGARQLYFILRNGKWDIPAYFGDGTNHNLSIAYLIMGLPFGAPFSVDQAYTFVKDKQVLFGFPDILISQGNVFAELLAKQVSTKADVVLGVFEVDQPERWDVVELKQGGEVKSIHPKPHASDINLAWAFACWGPSFTQFMHSHLQSVCDTIKESAQQPEISMGSVLQAAIQQGLQVNSVPFNKNVCLDIGTPSDLQKAILKYS